MMNINSFRTDNTIFDSNVAYYGSAVTARTNTKESTFILIKTNFTSN